MSEDDKGFSVEVAAANGIGLGKWIGVRANAERSVRRGEKG